MILKKITLGFMLFLTSILVSQTVVETHGRLRVQGNQIVDQFLNPTSLAGNSLFWSNADDTANYYNAETVEHLANDWGSTLIRCAMGVNEPWDGGRGYINSPAFQENKIRAVIDAAIDQGIYVIIDWHTHEAEIYEEEAVEFFTRMAQIYGDEPNVIYEIYNEPINQSWSTIKNYAEAVIAGIRSEDPDNLIIVGTPFFSQRVDVASLDPISDVNTAYTLHFYAGTHGNDLRNIATTAMNNGVALFVTEWGSVNADGNGNANVQGTEQWMQFCRDNNLSHANWAVSDKSEGASIVQSGAGLNGLLNNQLTGSGLLIQDIIANWNTGAESNDPGDSNPSTTTCNTIACIRNAMANAQPGDEIIIASGTYQMTTKIPGNLDRNSYLYASNSGTEANPIVLRAQNNLNPPVIRGIDYNDGYLMSIDGDYWNIQNIVFETGSKGLMLDNANNIQLLNLTVRDVGDEGIHFRDGSSNNLVDGCRIRDVGQNQPGFGEGIYVGSDRSQHDIYDPESNNNTIQNSIIGPNVAAEGVDIREGTSFTIVRDCTFSAQGISGQNSGDAFIDLKGAYSFIYNNTFNLDGSTILNAGIDFLDRGTGFNTGFRNAVFNNTFNLGNRANQIPTARRRQGNPVETHVWDNIRIPASNDFPLNDGTFEIVNEFCPEWNILPCDGINEDNDDPVVNITTPQGNLTVQEGYTSLPIVAEASDSDGTIIELGLYIEDEFIRYEVLPPYEWGNNANQAETLGLGVGTYTFFVVAFDNEDASAEDSFTLTVTEASNEAPTIAFTTPSNNLTVQEGYESLQIAAAASDSDGTVLNSRLFINGELVRIDFSDPYQWGLGNNQAETLGLEVGTHTFRVVATDDDGATGEDTFVLTVTEAPNVAPTVAFTTPSNDLTVQEGYEVLQITAAASDSDGNVLNSRLFINNELVRIDFSDPYQWGLGNNQAETLGLEVGTHTFRVVATDNDGATAEDTFVLTVTEAPNVAPTVAFTLPSNDLTVQEGYGDLQIRATAADSDGTVTTVGLFIDDVLVRNDNTDPYRWGSGNNQAETLGLEVGTHTFRVVATDNDGATAEDTFVLTVTEAPNEAPTVAFTTPSNDLTVQEGYGVLQITAAASDSDGNVLNSRLFINNELVRIDFSDPYQWGFGNNQTETLGLTVGTHTFRVVATDNDGATAEDTFVLTVTEAPNQAPTVTFTTPFNNLTVQEGYDVLEVVATATDGDGTVENLGLFIDNVLVRTEVFAPYEWGFGNNQAETLGLTAGSYTFRVVATDNDGATAEDTFVLTVTEPSIEAPIVAFTTPSGNLTVQEGYDVLEVVATATDVDGMVVNVGLFIGDELVRTDATAPYQWGLGNNQAETLGLEVGTHTFRVVATDNDGATAEDIFVLTVTEAPNEAPTVAFTTPSGNLTVQEGYEVLQITAAASDSDGTVLNSRLFINNELVRIDFSAPYQWGFGNNQTETLGLAVGTHTFRVVATDDDGATAEDTFVLTVTEAPNEAPTVAFTAPSTNLTVQEGYDVLQVIATATDGDGTVANVGLFIDDVLVRTDATAPYRWGFENNQAETLGLTAGTYIFSVIATDNDGATAEDTFILTVTEASNEVPTVAFTTPSNNLTVQEGYDVLEIIAMATDGDGSIENLGLFIDDVLVRTEVFAPYEWGFGDNQAETLGLTAGTYTFSVVATDNDGATAEDTFILTVTELPNEAPTVSFTTPSSDITVEEGYASLEILATAQDADGIMESVSLYIDDILIRSDFEAPYQWGIGENQNETLGLAAGIYTFRVIAVDDDGAASEDTFQLTVSEVLSLDNAIQESEVKVYPNPTIDHFFVSGLNQKQGTIEVVDLLGRIVLTQDIQNESESINISRLSEGAYIIVINVDNSRIQRKLVKAD